VEGDSASAAELLALLSALGEIPLRQDIAVTGSVNQHGAIQPIGGVNEKIEGFFAVCKRVGLNGTQGVVIPASNARNLMLKEQVVRAVAGGQFHVWPVSTIDQAIVIFTGMEPGDSDALGSFPAGTFNAAVLARLDSFADVVRAAGNSSRENGNGQ
jgi:predicted ATP-dependent protease